jgi:hypothetical protein
MELVLNSSLYNILVGKFQGRSTFETEEQIDTMFEKYYVLLWTGLNGLRLGYRGRNLVSRMTNFTAA